MPSRIALPPVRIIPEASRLVKPVLTVVGDVHNEPLLNKPLLQVGRRLLLIFHDQNF
jgi:hypothetical protein